MIEFLKHLAKQAGTLAYADNLRLKASNIHTKSTVFDLVTDTDRKVEDFIVSELEKQFPDYGIYGEESGKNHAEREYCFVIDPIDGTSSFVHGQPFWCVSIGLVRNGKSVAGVVYQPVMDDLYYAEAGKGSYVNGIRMEVTGRDNLAECILATGFACLRAQWKEENNLKFFTRIAPELAGVRRFGSAAIDCCLTARGQLDGYWELYLQPYDVAAGVIIAKEAGAVVSDLFGNEDYPARGFMVTNGKIHRQLLGYFHDYRNLKR